MHANAISLKMAADKTVPAVPRLPNSASAGFVFCPGCQAFPGRTAYFSLRFSTRHVQTHCAPFPL